MIKYSHILLEFINSFESSDLSNALMSGYTVIFEDSMTSTSGDMYSNGIKPIELATTNADDGTEYVGDEMETFGAEPSDLVDDLDLFDIEKVTMHDNNDALKAKFQATNTYKTLIPQMKSTIDSHKLMQSHMNTSDGGVKILKA
jgi:hypothetical protein